jgi:chromosome segregation ATPase
MTEFLDDLLNDFDAEFGLNSQVTPPASFSQHEAVSQSRSPVRQDSSEDRSARRLSGEHAIADLKLQRARDAEQLQQLQTENARLVAKLTILEHTDLKVAELGARVEQLLQKYLEAEQVRQQQAAQITELRQEVVVLRSRLAGRH